MFGPSRYLCRSACAVRSFSRAKTCERARGKREKKEDKDEDKREDTDKDMGRDRRRKLDWNRDRHMKTCARYGLSNVEPCIGRSMRFWTEQLAPRPTATPTTTTTAMKEQSSAVPDDAYSEHVPTVLFDRLRCFKWNEQL
jgi:hypothetical protein